jgi:hypothetical protein
VDALCSLLRSFTNSLRETRALPLERWNCALSSSRDPWLSNELAQGFGTCVYEYGRVV